MVSLCGSPAITSKGTRESGYLDMNGRTYVFDPEGDEDPGLMPGTQYVEPGPGSRGVRRLSRPDGATVEVHQSDLIRARDKRERLEAAAVHIAYEADMLRRCWEAGRSRTAYTSWFVHFRNLWTCFHEKGHNDDEICAQDFFDRPEDWHQKRRGMLSSEDTQLIRDYHKAADELAVHLSYNRDREVYQGRIPNEQLTSMMLRLYETLVAAQPEDRRAWFHSPL